MDFECCEICGPGEGWIKLCGLFRGHILCLVCSRKWMELGGEVSWDEFCTVIEIG
jgi:hypothetical protein